MTVWSVSSPPYRRHDAICGHSRPAGFCQADNNLIERTASNLSMNLGWRADDVMCAVLIVDDLSGQTWEGVNYR